MFELAEHYNLIDLQTLPTHSSPSLGHVSHPVQAYLNTLAPSSRRPQLSALDWIARRSTQVYTAESMPWQRLRRPHVLKIRGLLEEHYQPATANGMCGELRVRRGKGKKRRQVTRPPSTVPALKSWLEVRGPEPGSLFCAVLKSGRLVRSGAAPARFSPGAAWRICRERGLKGQIQAPAPHDLRRTWIGDLLDMGVDLATVQKMAGHASASTTAGYDRRYRGVQRRAAVLLQVPYAVPED